MAPKRERMVWRRDYKYFYWLNLLDGVRQQIFFSFGLWVLVHRFKLTVAELSLILMTVTFVTIFSSSYVGKLIDRIGERRVLQAINVGYIFALGGYALANDVYLACVFYVLYSFVAIFSSMGANIYLRKIAVPQEVAPSLAMGVTILHATAVVVPVAAGFILHFVRLPDTLLHSLRRRAGDGVRHAAPRPDRPTDCRPSSSGRGQVGAKARHRAGCSRLADRALADRNSLLDQTKVHGLRLHYHPLLAGPDRVTGGKAELLHTPGPHDLYVVDTDDQRLGHLIPDFRVGEHHDDAIPGNELAQAKERTTINGAMARDHEMPVLPG